jgi:hypothetical protein
MNRELSFTNLGRVLVILVFVLYAGCVLPVTQVCCIMDCLQGMTMPGDVTGRHCIEVTDNSGSLACHSPTSTDLMVISHNSEEWAQNVEVPLPAIPEARFDTQWIMPATDMPDLSVQSPPPKSSSLV